MQQNSEHQNHPRPKKLGGKFAAATAVLGTITLAAVFKDATAVAVASGIATGIMTPVTAYVLFAEGMSA